MPKDLKHFLLSKYFLKMLSMLTASFVLLTVAVRIYEAYLTQPLSSCDEDPSHSFCERLKIKSNIIRDKSGSQVGVIKEATMYFNYIWTLPVHICSLTVEMKDPRGFVICNETMRFDRHHYPWWMAPFSSNTVFASHMRCEPSIKSFELENCVWSLV